MRQRIVGLFFLLFLFSGCVPNKSVLDINNNADKKGSDTGEYKLLYNPLPGGNPENIGKIIYASDSLETPNTDYDIYTINPDGSNKTKLTSYAKFTNHPVWSPEYSRFAYTTRIDFHDKICIMTVDGSESRQLTFGDSDDKFPTWSPDGQWIAYISYRDKIPNLWVMDIYGENVKQLTFVDGQNTVLWPSWSPDGEVIAFSYNQAGEDVDVRLHTIKPDGTDEKEILSSNDPDVSDREPAWSPDGKTIYFISNRSSQNEIWKINYPELDGLQQISQLDSVNTHPDHRPRVSPDGTKIVFDGVGADWNDIGTSLYVINIDGSNLTNITKSRDTNEWADWW